MSDNLVKRARHNANADMPHHASVSLIEEMADRIEELEAKLSKSEALLAKAVDAVGFAYDTLGEINPSNYDHDDVCNLNDKSVEVIICLGATLAELSSVSCANLKGQDDER